MLSKGILITSPLEINLHKFTFSTGYPVTFSNTFSKVFLKIEFTSIFYFSKIFQKSVIRLASWRKSADSDIMTNVGEARALSGQLAINACNHMTKSKQ